MKKNLFLITLLISTLLNFTILYSEESFMDQYIHRFQSKKIYGEGLDLSVSHLSRDILSSL